MEELETLHLSIHKLDKVSNGKSLGDMLEGR